MQNNSVQHQYNNKFVIIISGPTASGKTGLSELLTKKFNCQIINADMGQFYTPLNIGTAKPDLNNIKYKNYLFNILDEPKDLTIFQYRDLVINSVNKIWSQGDIPIIVGGSFFYLKSLFFLPVEKNLPISSKTEKQSFLNSQDLWQTLNNIDPERAQNIHPNDTYRLNRALDIYFKTGQKPSVFKPVYSPLFNSIFIYLDLPKDLLLKNINERTNIMIKKMGWIKEAENLLNTQWQDFIIKKNIIGYPELFNWINSGSDISKLDQIIESIIIKTRQYAKKQKTFWKSFKSLLENNKQNSPYFLDLIDINDLEKSSFEKIFVAVNHAIR